MHLRIITQEVIVLDPQTQLGSSKLGKPKESEQANMLTLGIQCKVAAN